MRDELRIRAGQSPHLATRATGDRLGFRKGKAAETLADLTDRLNVLQGRLWAERKRCVLLVLQGMDAAGKDGTIRRVFTGLSPAGCHVAAFRAPTYIEADHDYLWRIHQHLPARGQIGIFNRSHYEDVVTARVLDIIDDATRARRHRQIREFERMLHEEGTTLLKVFLHVGKAEQRERLEARLADPEKRWKFSPDDLKSRAQWDDYQRLYDESIAETSTADASWYVVPADHKWVSGLAVATMLVEVLEEMDPRTPPPDPRLDGLHVE